MNRIKELRISSNLTQSELAVRIGLNQSAIGKYERGELEPSISTLKSLSKIFECSIDYILCNSDDFGVVKIIGDNTPIPSEAQELVEMFLQLTPMHRTQVLEYARYFVERESATKKKNI